MNRPFDYKWTWLDDEGKPLAGKVEFCKLHTTVLENIYDNQGYPASNPIFTEVQTGQLVHQVFLKDKTDYTVRWYKYVGNGDMTEDQDNWLFLYSADVLWDVYGVEFETDAYQVVDNIAALRTTEPEAVKTRDNRKVVLLGGYYQLADKPTVMYIWNPTSIASDNGGDVIKVDTVNTGRWELVNHFDESGVDVRHFGVFGADGISDAADAMSLAIGIASNYAASINRPLYFPSNEGSTWYKVNSLNISGAIFAKGTKVFGNTGTESRITVRDQDTYLDVYTNANYNGVFTIAGDVVRTSWGVNSTSCIFEPELKLIVDSPVNTSHKDWADIIVDVLEPIDHVQFTHCQLNAIGTIGNWSTFHDMRITESMFRPNVSLNTITVFDDDIIDLSDFPTTSTWFSLVLQNTGRTFDFEGRTVDSTCVNDTVTDCKYVNAVFDGYVVKQPGVKFVNCSGSLVMDGVTDVELEGCKGLVLGGSGLTLDSVESVDSVFSFGRSMTVDSVGLVRSKENDEGYVLYVADFTAEGSELLCRVSGASQKATSTVFRDSLVVVDPDFTDCTFYGTVNQTVTDNVADFTFNGCKFYGGEGHKLAATVADTTVAGKWIGNFSSLDSHFVVLDRTNLSSKESDHSYTYYGNDGPHVLQRLAAKWRDVVYTGPDYPGQGDVHGVLQNRVLYNAWSIGDSPNQSIAMGYLGRMGNEIGEAGGTTLSDYYLTEVEFFSVGTEDVGELAMTCHMPQKITSDMVVGGGNPGAIGFPFTSGSQATWASLSEVEKPWHSSATGALGVPKGIMYYGGTSGYVWRITSVQGMCLVHRVSDWPLDTWVDYEIPVAYEIKPV